MTDAAFAAPNGLIMQPASELPRTPLPLCVLSKDLSWMTPKGAEDGLRTHRHLEWLWKNCPSVPLWRSRPLIEIGD
jgi:hypothetical protein